MSKSRWASGSLTLLLAIQSITAHAEQPTKWVIQHKNDDLSKVYIMGVGQGFTLANAALSARKSEPLFCAPDNLVMTPEHHISILEGIVKLEPGTANEDAPLVLLVGLQRKYPCR